MPEENGANPEATNTGSENTENQINDTDIDLESLDSNNDVDDLRGNLRTTVEQKRHWREKAQTAEARLKELESDPRFKEEKPAEKPAPAKKSDGKETADEREARLRSEIKEEVRVQTKYPELSDEQMAKAQRLAKAEETSLMEMVESPYFQAFLKAENDKAEAEGARPNPSNRSGNPTGGYTTADLDDAAKVSQMSNETFQKLSEQKAKEDASKSTVIHHA